MSRRATDPLSLQHILDDQNKRHHLIDDCVAVIESQVQKQSGFSGLALKSAIKMAQAASPKIIHQALEHLIDDFVEKLEPFFEAYAAPQDKHATFASFLSERADEVADAWLEVVDKRAHMEKAGPFKKTYAMLRPKAKTYVASGIPSLAEVIERHARNYLPVNNVKN